MSLKILSVKNSTLLKPIKNKSKVITKSKVSSMPIVALPMVAHMVSSSKTGSIGSDIPDELQNLSQNISDMDAITEYGSPDLASNIAMTDIGSMLGEELVSELETAKEALTSMPLIESTYVLSLLIKAKDPIVDIKNKRYKDAGIRTVVRVCDTAIYPIKQLRALVGGIKGAVLSIKGVESDHTGFIKGYKDSLGKWVKGRRKLEEYMIDPDKMDEPTSAEKYEKLKELERQAIENWKKSVETASANQGKLLNEWFEQNLNYHDSVRNNLEKILYADKERSEFYKTQLDNIIKKSDMDVKTVQNDLELMKKEQQNLKIMYDQYIDDLRKSYEYLNDETLISQKIEQISAEVREFYEQRQEKLTAEIDKINKLCLINEKLQSKKSLKGMDKLAGYSDLKSNMYKLFINPIKQLNAGMDADIPNMILLYGSKGCGKSMMANALGEETGCKVINIDISLNAETDKKALENAVRLSKDNYDRSETHTIIRIEEIDNLLSNESLSDNLKNTFENLAKENHCTIIATTNNPTKINTELLPKKNLSTIYVSPANKEDIKEIFKYYANDFADAGVNYDELAQQVLDIAYKDAYSNAQIAGIINKGIKTRFLQNGSLNQQDFIEILNESYPDIKKEVLNSYIKKGI